MLFRSTEQIKRYGEGLIKTWLLDQTDQKTFKMNLSNIRSIGLLKELAQYDTDPRKNFDRVMALVCVMYQMQEEREYTPDMDDKPKFVPMHKRGFFAGRSQRPPMQKI